MKSILNVCDKNKSLTLASSLYVDGVFFFHREFEFWFWCECIYTCVTLYIFFIP